LLEVGLSRAAILAALLPNDKTPDAGGCGLTRVSRPDIILPAEWYTEAAIGNRRISATEHLS